MTNYCYQNRVDSQGDDNEDVIEECRLRGLRDFMGSLSIV